MTQRGCQEPAHFKSSRPKQLQRVPNAVKIHGESFALRQATRVSLPRRLRNAKDDSNLHNVILDLPKSGEK